MEILVYSAIFIFGLAVGSFLNCVIYRLEKGESFLRGRSHCPHCRHVLSWLDLIPLLSFLALRGKCRYCKKPISRQYPLVEVATALIFLLIFNFKFLIFSEFLSAQFLNLFFYLTIASFLIIIFVYDLKHYIIPDKIIYPAVGITFIYQFFRIWNFGHGDLFKIWDLGFGILPAFLFLAIIVFSRGRWMGFGDFKLAIFMGLILSWPNILVAMFLAYTGGAAIGLALIFTKRKTMKSEVPFGPFLATGAFLALFFGDKIINGYLAIL